MDGDRMIALVSKRLRACLLALVSSVLAGASATAQQFSADLVTRQGEKVVRVGSLRVSERKVRIETTVFRRWLLSGRRRKACGLFRAPARQDVHGLKAIKSAYANVCSGRSRPALPAMAGDGVTGCAGGSR